MPRYKPTDYAQTRLIPLSLPDQLQPGTLEYAIHYLLEERLDLNVCAIPIPVRRAKSACFTDDCPAA